MIKLNTEGGLVWQKRGGQRGTKDVVVRGMFSGAAIGLSRIGYRDHCFQTLVQQGEILEANETFYRHATG